MVTNSDQNSHAARSLCEKNLWPDVLELSKKWLAENPSAAKAFFYQGVALAAMGRLIEAETSYRRALALDANDFKTWNNLATLLFDALNRPGDAIKCLDEALKIEPANALGWANLASMNGQLGRHAQALASAERALILNPQMVEAQLHRARAAQMLGQNEIVQATCKMLAQLPPEKFQRAR
jgi:tetratricopeptide (TPR) repeat protein